MDGQNAIIDSEVRKISSHDPFKPLVTFSFLFALKFRSFNTSMLGTSGSQNKIL